jgi:hypothetical protein
MAIKTGISLVIDNYGKLLKGVDAMVGTQVLVGVPADKAPRKGEAINSAQLAYIHDNGAPEANIPARPFMAPGVKSVENENAATFKKIGQAALDLRMDAVDRGFHQVGLRTQAAIKNKIASNIPPPLGEATLAARRRRGVTRTNTLIDTGNMQNSINYVIRKKGKDI